jgi:uncharacterized membrane protein
MADQLALITGASSGIGLSLAKELSLLLKIRTERIWVRTSALIQADANDSYKLWHDIENAPPGRSKSCRLPKPATSHWVMRSGDKDSSDDKTIEASYK